MEESRSYLREYVCRWRGRVCVVVIVCVCDCVCECVCLRVYWDAARLEEGPLRSMAEEGPGGGRRSVSITALRLSRGQVTRSEGAQRKSNYANHWRRGLEADEATVEPRGSHENFISLLSPLPIEDIHSLIVSQRCGCSLGCAPSDADALSGWHWTLCRVHFTLHSPTSCAAHRLLSILTCFQKQW